MVAFNFKAQFAPLVAARTKRQTIRKSQRCNVGDRVRLYTGQRTKDCRRLVEDDATCTAVCMVMLSPTEFKLEKDSGGQWGDNPDRDAFARDDGFIDYADMLAWFRQMYGVSSFTGYVHKWDWPASPDKGRAE